MATRPDAAEVRSPSYNLLSELVVLSCSINLVVLFLIFYPDHQSENGSTGLPDCGDAIDPLTFEQILEMDDDEDEREFSKSIVYGFFEQAESTFVKMDSCM